MENEDRSPYVTIMNDGKGWIAALVEWTDDQDMFNVSEMRPERPINQTHAAYQARQWAAQLKLEYRC